MPTPTVGTSSNIKSAGFGASSVTFAHTVNAGSNRGLLVMVIGHDQSIGFTGCTFGGTALTQIQHQGLAGNFVAIYYLQDPTVTTADIVVTRAGGTWFSAGAINLTDSNHQLTIYDTVASAGSSTVSITLTGTSADAVIIGQFGTQGFWYGGRTSADAGGQTNIYEQEPTIADRYHTWASYKPAGGTVTLTWTITGGDMGWAAQAISVGFQGTQDPEPVCKCEGGGEVVQGINPAPGVIPTTLPIIMVHLRTVAGVDYWFAHHETDQLNDPGSWFGKKPGKVVNVSTIRTALSRHGDFEGSRFTVTLADADRQFRTLASQGAFRGAFCEVLAVDDAVRRAFGVPFRGAAGLVSRHAGPPGFHWTFDVEDVLGRRLAELNSEPMVPPDRYTLAEFPGLDPAAEGKPIPVLLGKLADPEAATPQGVVPPQYVGQVNFATFWGGANINADAYVWSKGACHEVCNVWYNEPDTPDLRLIVPDAAFGTIVWTPGKPGWSDTGFPSAQKYIDHLGTRYTPLFVDRADPHAQAAREGRILIAGDICGMEEDGDGLGRLIDSPARQWQWVLTNVVFQRYQAGAYLSIPLINGAYSIIDTVSVETARLAHLQRLGNQDYLGAFMLGRDGHQQTLFEFLAELCQGADMDQAINRHGQLILSVDAKAPPVLMFNATRDIEDGQYEAWIDSELYLNRLEHLYARYYLPPKAPPATVADGEPVATQLQPYTEWLSGLHVREDLIAQQIVNEEKTVALDNYVLRDMPTANNVEESILARGLGPQKDGPRLARFTTGYRGFGEGSTYLDLGSTIRVETPERIGAAAGFDDCRIIWREWDPMRHRVTLGLFIQTPTDFMVMVGGDEATAFALLQAEPGVGEGIGLPSGVESPDDGVLFFDEVG